MLRDVYYSLCLLNLCNPPQNVSSCCDVFCTCVTMVTVCCSTGCVPLFTIHRAILLFELCENSRENCYFVYQLRLNNYGDDVLPVTSISSWLSYIELIDVKTHYNLTLRFLTAHFIT